MLCCLPQLKLAASGEAKVSPFSEESLPFRKETNLTSLNVPAISEIQRMGLPQEHDLVVPDDEKTCTVALQCPQKFSPSFMLANE